MRHAAITLSATFLMLSLFIIFPGKTYACWCVKPEPNEAMENSEAIFTGTLIETRSERKPNEKGVIDFRTAYLFEVQQSWKGVNHSKITIYDEGNSCSYPFEKGKTYLVYSYTWEDGLYTDGCTRTADISEAAEDLKFLGEGKVFEKNMQDKKALTLGENSSFWIFIAGVMIVTVTAILMKWTVNRERK